MSLQKFAETLLNWLLPRQCYGCRNFSEDALCQICADELKPISVRSQTIQDLTCYSLMPYDGLAKHLLSYLKFEKIHSLGPFFYQAIPDPASFLPNQSLDYWVPIPLHPKRRRARGYNQVDLIFKNWALKHNHRYQDLIIRTQNTPPLFELNPQERKDVLTQAFELKDGISVQDKTIVLLDDIITTGQTMLEVSTVLKTHGAKKVIGISFCVV